MVETGSICCNFVLSSFVLIKESSGRVAAEEEESAQQLGKFSFSHAGSI